MLAICAAGFAGVNPPTQDVSGVSIQSMVKTAVPMILNERWMIVVRFAFRPVPMDANPAVIQVLFFCSFSTYPAPEKEIAPLVASA